MCLPTNASSTPAFFNGRLYYGVWAGNASRFNSSMACSIRCRYPGPPSSVIRGDASRFPADGTSNGSSAAEKATTTMAILHAYEAQDVSNEIYNSNQAADGRDQFGTGNKFVVPAIANGKVYVGTEGGVGVFGLFNPPRLANVSARAQVGAGDNVLIAGFIIEGSAGRTLVIRGIGPSISIGGLPLAGTLQRSRAGASQQFAPLLRQMTTG